MITTYFRSSSLSTFDWCEAKYLFVYLLGEKDPANKSASKGSLVHKILECLAWSKKCQQDGLEYFEDDILGRIKANQSHNEFFELFKDHYATEYKNHWIGTPFEKNEYWRPADFRDCINWIENTLSFKNGAYDPRNCHIVYPERFFDIELDFDWANYRFEIGDIILEGKLKLRGTMDLTIQIDENTYRIVDYKTGSLTNFKYAHRPDKKYEDLCEDQQFKMYYYVAKKLYEKQLQFEALYNKYPKSFLLYMDDQSANSALATIKQTFEKIKKIEIPKFAKRSNNKTPCKFCIFNKMDTCDKLEKELLTIGSGNGIIVARDNLKSLNQYDGGGKVLQL